MVKKSTASKKDEQSKKPENILASLGEGVEMVDVTLHLMCSKCGKPFTYSYSYLKQFPDPCMQGLIPDKCPACGGKQSLGGLGGSSNGSS